MDREAPRRWCPWCTGQRIPVAGACERCGSPHCAACALSACAGCDVLARLHAVLRGEDVSWSPPVLTSEAARETWSKAVEAGAHRGHQKLHHILRTFGSAGRDVRVAPHVVEIRVLGRPGRHDYYPKAGPHMLRDLMRTMDVRVVEEPLVGLARGGHFWKWASESAADELVWIVPAADHVELRLRPVHAEPPPRAIPIPEEGPLALPKPWSWSAPAPVFIDSDPPGTRCPYCGVHATRHRALGAALVCPGCGGSFDHR